MSLLLRVESEFKIQTYLKVVCVLMSFKLTFFILSEMTIFVFPGPKTSLRGRGDHKQYRGRLCRSTSVVRSVPRRRHKVCSAVVVSLGVRDVTLPYLLRGFCLGLFLFLPLFLCGSIVLPHKILCFSINLL